MRSLFFSLLLLLAGSLPARGQGAAAPAPASAACPGESCAAPAGAGAFKALARRGRVVPVAVLDFTAVAAPSELAQNLTALVASELGRYDDLKAITRREISSLLDFDRQRSFAGCAEDGCMTQLAGALGVAKVLTGQIGRIENTFVLTLQLLDAQTAKVEARVSRTAAVQSEGLVDATKAAVTDLIGAHSSRSNQAPRVAVASGIVAHRGDRVALDATRCYDPEGDPLHIGWRQIDGPPALLEGGGGALASFEAADVGSYLFAVQVGDGRSLTQEQQVRVEVRERRRFQLALGYQQLLSFNRLVEQDAAGNAFRNRAPVGGAGLGMLKLSSRWRLIFEGGAGFMHLYPEDGRLEASEALDVRELHLLVGPRYDFPLDGFAFYVSARVGTARVFYAPKGQGEGLDAIRSQDLVADGSLGLDVPLGERLGLIVEGGVRGRAAMHRIAPFPGVSYQVARNGLLWGASVFAGPYVRL